MKKISSENNQITDIFKLFYDVQPSSFETINTSHGDCDFREVILVKDECGKNYVIKLADNDFTFPDKISMWQRTAEEYCKSGYFCPKIFCDKTGNFPIISYKGRNCVAYAEEYSSYRSADSFKLSEDEIREYEKCKWIMTAKIASKYFDYTSYPSGYCMFEKFCPSDESDEVLGNASEWYRCAKSLPSKFQEQIDRIWFLWNQNRQALEPLYKQLPTSVFQADLNPTNILLDNHGKFVGVYDMNLCGKDVFINYLMRENYNVDFEKEFDMIFNVLKTASLYYRFSDMEKQTILMLYRCIKPLWYSRVQRLKSLENNTREIHDFLNETEMYLTKPIDFTKYMQTP